MNYIEITIAGKTYIQRNEYSVLKEYDKEGNIEQVDFYKSPYNNLKNIIEEGLIIQKNINKYFNYTINWDDEIIIESINNVDNLSNIVIPQYIEGKKVAWIKGLRNLQADRIFLPETLHTIFCSCFEKNEYIREVYLPPSITTISERCFKNCTNLEKINLNHIIKIDKEAFNGCENLANINLENLEDVRLLAFNRCYKIKEVISPKLNYIGTFAFEYCTNLEAVETSNNLKNINANAFRCCYNLSQINSSDNLEEICIGAFEGCKSLYSFTFPNKLKEIGTNAFNESGLRGNLFLPDSLEEIKEQAFAGCKFDNISISKNTIYLPSVFDLYNIDKIKTRKEIEIKNENEIER